MTATSSQPPPDSLRERQPSSSSTEPPPLRPWRTEGLPKGQPTKPRPRWLTMEIWVDAYLMLFVMLTLQDQLSRPQPVPYTDFKTQVTNKNVAELFARGDSIEGQLKN